MSERVSVWDVRTDLEGSVGQVVQVEKDCGGTCAGQTRGAVPLCWKLGEGLEHRWQGYSFLIGS